MSFRTTCVGLAVLSMGQYFGSSCHSQDYDSKKSNAAKIVQALTIEIGGLNDPDPELFEERGDAFMDLGDFHNAFDDYSMAIDRTPNGISTYFLLHKRCGAAVGKGDYRQALEDSQDLAKASPPRSEALAILALILSRSPDEKVKNPAKALDIATQAATVTTPPPNRMLVEQALAAAHSANGNFAAAVKHQERAIGFAEGHHRRELNAQLDAYKAKREYPFPAKSNP